MLNTWGKMISYTAAFCEDVEGQEDVSRSTSTSEMFSIANTQSIPNDCCFFLQLCFVLVCVRNNVWVHRFWFLHLVWCLTEVQTADNGSSQRGQVLWDKLSSIRWQECTFFLSSMEFRSQVWDCGCLWARWFIFYVALINTVTLK